jgi:hypothetical protein
MAKKKKRGSSAPSAAIESEIEDILVTILDECGALGSSNHENPPWGQMALAVFGLANALEKLALGSEPFQSEQSSEENQNHPNHDDYNNNHHHNKILEVETAAQQVIRQCDSGSIEIRKQANRLFLLCHEAECVFHSDSVLKHHHDKVKLQRVRIVMRSVACAIRQRTNLAETVITEILSCLAHLYSVDAPHSSSVVGKLRDCGRLLQRECIEMDSLPWREALELVAGIRPEHTTTDQVKRPTFHHRAILSKDVVDQRGDSPRTQQYSETSTPDKSSLTPSNTIFKAIHAFLDQDHLDPTTSNVTSLLLVGPEGSGKTVFCDKIEKLAADFVQGT